MVENYLIYLRKSRADGEQTTVEEVLAKHEVQLQEFAVKEFGAPIPEDNIFREVVSGETIENRPEMKRVISAIQTRKYIGVIVIEPQRLSRGDLLDTGTIVNAFRYTGTLVVTPQKTYNLEDKFDRKFFEMELMRGNDYLEYVKEIMQRGRIASVKAGNFIGQHPPYGYRKAVIDKSHTLIPEPKEAAVVKLVFDMFVNQHMGTTNIANKLNDMGIKPPRAEHWAQFSIRDMLQNPVHIGKVRWNYRTTKKNYVNGKLVYSNPLNRENMIIADGKHEGIIDEETFYKAQERFGNQPRTKGWSELRNPLATLIKCKTCGRSMSYRTYKNKSGEERCAPRLLCVNQTHCHTRSAVYDDIEQELTRSLKASLSDFSRLLKADDGNSDRIKNNLLHNLSSELSDIEAQQERLYIFLENGTYSEELFVKRNGVLADRRAKVQKAIEQTTASISAAADYQRRIYMLEDAIEALENDSISAKQKNEALKRVIERIEYSNDAEYHNKYIAPKIKLEVFLRF